MTMMMTGVIETDVADSLVETRRVLVKHKNGTQAMEISKFMVGVIAARFDMSKEIEVLKAESIMVRTDIYRIMGDSMQIESTRLGMDYLTESEMKVKWGDQYEENYNLIADCIYVTSGRTMSYQDKLIAAEYTAISSGKTRNGSEVKGEEYSYLVTLECSEDMQAEKYLEVKTIQSKDFVKSFKDIYKNYDTQNVNIMETIQIVSRCSAEYVEKVQVGNIIMTGEEFATALGLKSSCFYIESFNGNGIKITTKGKGNGFGVSMNIADLMAKNGNSCDEILRHFYNNINFINE